MAAWRINNQEENMDQEKVIGKYKGIWYVSETFVKYKTISFVVNKQALPKDIADKLKL